jgi:hypothetical protein
VGRRSGLLGHRHALEVTSAVVQPMMVVDPPTSSSNMASSETMSEADARVVL